MFAVGGTHASDAMNCPDWVIDRGPAETYRWHCEHYKPPSSSLPDRCDLRLAAGSAANGIAVKVALTGRGVPRPP